jgi:hypothetical protein
MSYTTKAQVEQYLQHDINSQIDSFVDTWIAWVQAYIDRYCGRTFGSTAITTKYYDGTGRNELYIDDCTAVSVLQILDPAGTVVDTVAADEFWLYPLNLAQKNRIVLNGQGLGAFPAYPRSVKVTGTFGVASVPAEIQWAATALVADIVKSQPDVARAAARQKLGEYEVEFVPPPNLKATVEAILDLHKVYAI